MVEAPDILYNETSNDTIVPEGASVRLHCEARGYPEPTVVWRREDGALIVLRAENGQKIRRGEAEGDFFSQIVSTAPSPPPPPLLGYTCSSMG